jgi:hypothetical protein
MSYFRSLLADAPWVPVLARLFRLVLPCACAGDGASNVYCLHGCLCREHTRCFRVAQRRRRVDALPHRDHRHCRRGPQRPTPRDVPPHKPSRRVYGRYTFSKKASRTVTLRPTYESLWVPIFLNLPMNVANVQGTDIIYLQNKKTTSVLAHSRRCLGDDYGYV